MIGTQLADLHQGRQPGGCVSRLNGWLQPRPIWRQRAKNPCRAGGVHGWQIAPPRGAGSLRTHLDTPLPSCRRHPIQRMDRRQIRCGSYIARCDLRQIAGTTYPVRKKASVQGIIFHLLPSWIVEDQSTSSQCGELVWPFVEIPRDKELEAQVGDRAEFAGDAGAD